jgi:hypothetical protein
MFKVLKPEVTEKLPQLRPGPSLGITTVILWLIRVTPAPCAWQGLVGLAVHYRVHPRESWRANLTGGGKPLEREVGFRPINWMARDSLATVITGTEDQGSVLER